MRCVGTVARGIRAPIIKTGDDLESIVIDSIMKSSKVEKFEFQDKDIIAITEGVVGIADGNFVTVDQIATDIKRKFPNGHIGYLFPTPVSRNRLAPFLRGIARGAKKITMQFAYPADREIHNLLFPEELLEKFNINPYSDILDEKKYNELFGDCVHEFTGVNYVRYFKELIEAEDCEAEFIFANNEDVILNYTKDILVGAIHTRDKVKKILQDKGANLVLGLDDIMTESIDGSGFNAKYGLLGSNKASEDKIKLFPYDKQNFVDNIQKRLKKLTGKTIEVLIYGDGAFKDPIGGIWELSDPCVSPYYTKGLEGTPNEVKLKYISNDKYDNLKGKELEEAIKNEIKNKDNNLMANMLSQGTTPRRYIDLIGSLCDLMSGSGDKGTPIIYISGYFDNLSDI